MNKQRKTSHILNVFQYDETTGAVTLPASLSLATPDSADNSTKVATTAWIRTYIGSLSYATSASVTAAIANLVASAPTTLDTLNELAAALGNDAAFSTTVSTALGNRLRVDINTQGLTSTQQGYGRTNLGLGTAATSNTSDFATAAHNHNGVYVPVGRTITINGTAYDLSADRAWTIASGVTSFNTRIGAITLTSGDVTGALGYTPYNATNPSGYISSYTETSTLANVTGRGSTTTTSITAERFKGNNSLVLNTFATVNPASNVFLYSQPNDRDSWIYLDSADTGSNWGIYHRQIDTTVSGLEGNSIGFIGGGTNGLKAYIGLSTGNGYFAGTISASNFSGSHSGTSSGTNTGDQTNISGNAVTAGGLAVHANRNNEANKIVRTDANGYIQAGWINTPSGAFGSAISKIYCSDDDYVRYQTPANFISNMGLITTSSIGSQSVSYATTAGNATTAYGWGNTPDSWYGIGQSTSASGATAVGGYYPWTLSYHTGLALSAHSAYGGIRFYNQNYPTGPLASTPAMTIINSVVYASNSFRAPIFYDSDDTGYYADFASTSRMNSIVYDNLKFSGDQTYGFLGRNLYADTINGRGSDPLEINYYDGGSVIIGSGANGSKALYAGSLYDSGSRVAISRGEGRNYVDYSRYVYNNGAYSGSGWIEPSDLGVRYANSAGSASSATYLPTAYVGGSQSNPQVYFNYSIGLKVAMTGAWSVWSDTMWINGYAGGDVPWMCALHFLRNSEPRMAISAQQRDSGGYGSYYEVITDYNVGSRKADGAKKLWATSHPNDYYIVNNWTGSYWQLTTNHGSAVQVGYADNAGQLSGFDKTNPSFGAVYASNWFRAQGDCGLYSQDYGGHFRRSTSSFGTWELFGYAKSGYAGIVTSHNYITAQMHNTSGDFGFLTENGNWWNLFYNNGNNCWGIGTDNTYSGDGFRCIKYGSAQYGWTTWSDRRAKENISSITGALDTVLAMRGVYFNYIQDEAKNKRVGFIAQELEQVLPEAVRYADEIDEYSVEYAQIVSVLAEAIKEQDAKMTAQETKIKRLEQLVEQLINQ